MKYRALVSVAISGTFCISAAACYSREPLGKAQVAPVARTRTETPAGAQGTRPSALRPAGSPDGQPLLRSSSLRYVGAFKVPGGSVGDSSLFDGLSYGGSSLAYNPARNSLYVVGNDQHQLTAEIGIPEPADSTALGSLPTAPVLQTLIDSLEGKLRSINPSDPNPQKIGAQLVFDGKLYVSGWSYYDGASTQAKSQFVRPLDLSIHGQVRGPFTVGATYPGWVNRYAAHIPLEWQSLFGGSALTGGCCGAIIGHQSWGPSVSVFTPSDVGVKYVVPAVLLVGYPSDHPTLGRWSHDAPLNPLYNMSTTIGGIVFPSGTRTILFFGKTGLGPSCYGPGTSDRSKSGTPAADIGNTADNYCYDPIDSSKGTHAFPYADYVWAYDANDLLSVKNRRKEPWAIKPYATWTMTLPFNSGTVVGAAYDQASRRIFVSQGFGNGTLPLIHVLAVESE